MAGRDGGRRAAILEAGRELFVDSGVAKCRVEDLLERSGASVGSFYHHFGSKEQVAATLYMDALEDFQSAFLAERDRHRSVGAAVRGVVVHHLEWVVDDPKRAGLLFECREPDVFPLCRDEDQRMRRAFLVDNMRWLRAGAERGELRMHSPLEWYVLWMGPALELSRAWLMNRLGRWTWMDDRQKQPASLLKARRSLADAAWRNLGA